MTCNRRVDLAILTLINVFVLFIFKCKKKKILPFLLGAQTIVNGPSPTLYPYNNPVKEVVEVEALFICFFVFTVYLCLFVFTVVCNTIKPEYLGPKNGPRNGPWNGDSETEGPS